MTKNTIKKISDNPNLIAFCNKILGYNAIFSNEAARSMFFVSLISADILIDKHSCQDTIDESNFILSHIDLFLLEDNIKNDVIKYCKDALKIAKREIKEFKS